MTARLVGYRREPTPFSSIYECILDGDTLRDRQTGELMIGGCFVPVYEGDAGWQLVEERTLAAKRGEA